MVVLRGVRVVVQLPLLAGGRVGVVSPGFGLRVAVAVAVLGMGKKVLHQNTDNLLMVKQLKGYR